MPDESPASQYRAYAANEADMPQSAAMSYSAAKGTMFLSDAVQEQHNFAIWERMTDYMDSRGMRCRDVFKAMDADGDHSIGITEIRKGFASMHIEITKKEVRSLLKELDEDHSGNINVGELENLLQQHKRSKLKQADDRARLMALHRANQSDDDPLVAKAKLAGWEAAWVAAAAAAAAKVIAANTRDLRPLPPRWMRYKVRDAKAAFGTEKVQKAAPAALTHAAWGPGKENKRTLNIKTNISDPEEDEEEKQDEQEVIIAGGITIRAKSPTKMQLQAKANSPTKGRGSKHGKRTGKHKTKSRLMAKGHGHSSPKAHHHQKGHHSPGKHGKSHSPSKRNAHHKGSSSPKKGKTRGFSSPKKHTSSPRLKNSQNHHDSHSKRGQNSRQGRADEDVGDEEDAEEAARLLAQEQAAQKAEQDRATRELAQKMKEDQIAEERAAEEEQIRLKEEEEQMWQVQSKEKSAQLKAFRRKPCMWQAGSGLGVSQSTGALVAASGKESQVARHRRLVLAARRLEEKRQSSIEAAELQDLRDAAQKHGISMGAVREIGLEKTRQILGLNEGTTTLNNFKAAAKRKHVRWKRVGWAAASAFSIKSGLDRAENVRKESRQELLEYLNDNTSFDQYSDNRSAAHAADKKRREAQKKENAEKKRLEEIALEEMLKGAKNRKQSMTMGEILKGTPPAGAGAGVSQQPQANPVDTQSQSSRKHVELHASDLPCHSLEKPGGFTPGDEIEANYKGRGRWYKGRVEAVALSSGKGRPKRIYDVRYADGDAEIRVAAKNVRLQAPPSFTERVMQVGIPLEVELHPTLGLQVATHQPAGKSPYMRMKTQKWRKVEPGLKSMSRSGRPLSAPSASSPQHQHAPVEGEHGLKSLGLGKLHAEALIFDPVPERTSTLRSSIIARAVATQKASEVGKGDTNASSAGESSSAGNEAAAASAKQKKQSDELESRRHVVYQEMQALAVRVGVSRFTNRKTEMGMVKKQKELASGMHQAWSSDYNRRGWLELQDPTGEEKRKNLSS